MEEPIRHDEGRSSERRSGVVARRSSKEINKRERPRSTRGRSCARTHPDRHQLPHSPHPRHLAAKIKSQILCAPCVLSRRSLGEGGSPRRAEVGRRRVRLKRFVLISEIRVKPVSPPFAPVKNPHFFVPFAFHAVKNLRSSVSIRG